MSECEHGGQGLDLFSHASRWKAYWSSLIRPLVKGDVLDVGAGQGNNLPILLNPDCTTWTALEPDARLLDKFAGLGACAEDVRLRKIAGSTETLLATPVPALFDCILYIDVLEHIDDDLAEFQRAVKLLKPNGWLIVLSPAFQCLYSPFDAAIGHYRRYERAGMKRLRAPGVTLDKLICLDALGFLLSASNRMLLRQSMPRLSQIQLWDQWVVPISRVIDPLLGHLFGRSIVGFWRKC